MPETLSDKTQPGEKQPRESLRTRSFRARTKIVATVGPACDSQQTLGELIQAGVNVFRINTAHGSREDRETAAKRIRAAAEQLGTPVGILLDLAGPKIRLGQLHTDPLVCEEDAELTFMNKDAAESPFELTSTYDPLISELRPGDKVLLADGAVALEVISTSENEARCRVTESGKIHSRQGINLPGVKLSTPSLTEADRANAEWAAAHDIDFVSLSFVRSADDIVALKELLAARGSSAMVIAKIEKPEALEVLEEIVIASDGVMVARGDLGVEIDVAETPVVQKRIIRSCEKHLKPVIVATQMLDSMQHSRRPTRAEATDVANAILDGADACMLSGETAVGDFPRETVAMMSRIIRSTERMLFDAAAKPPPVAAVAGVHPITSAVVYGAAQIASQLFCRLVVVATKGGNTARVKSKQRDFIPTIGVSRSPETLRKMCLFWGITPLDASDWNTGPELRRLIEQWGRAEGLLSHGDRVVFVTSGDYLDTAHNALFVHEVK